jgi:hypothetical protein
VALRHHPDASTPADLNWSPFLQSLSSRRFVVKYTFIIMPLVLLALSGCGRDPGERALTGAGIGAGVGLVGGAMVGAPLEGAAIGGAVGAGTGALTSPRQIDLNR